MASRKKEALVGKGVKQANINSKGDDFTIFQINKNAWKAFYASDEGKARLKKMNEINKAKQLRYQKLSLQGYKSGTTQTNRDLEKDWRNNQLKEDGTSKA